VNLLVILNLNYRAKVHIIVSFSRNNPTIYPENTPKKNPASQIEIQGFMVSKRLAATNLKRQP